MCGIVGLYNVRKAAELAVLVEHLINHRAREFAGVATSDGDDLHVKHGRGPAIRAFRDPEVLDLLHGNSAVGHIRYSTQDDKSKSIDNAHPIMGTYAGKRFALAHNGNLTNKKELKAKLPNARFLGSTDTECIVRLLERYDTGVLEEDLPKVFAHLKGSYTLAILFPDRLVAVMDPSSNRPLSVGSLNGGYIICSETVGLTNVGASFLYDMKPGTIVTFDSSGVHTQSFGQVKLRKCCFEHVYLGNPGSIIFGVDVADFRQRLGRVLETEAPADADIVAAVPDSAIDMAEGYGASGRSGVFKRLILRSHNIGRTFIAATQAKRSSEVARKFIYVDRRHIEGKRIVVVDDSIVRGTTLPKIVKMFRELGAKAIHVRIGSPAMPFQCEYGIDTKGKDLIAARMTVVETCSLVGADSLMYLSQEGLRSLYTDPDSYCYACMDGNYWGL